jgi:serine phosphatase RsbU (regulator of sigma subunit)
MSNEIDGRLAGSSSSAEKSALRAMSSEICCTELENFLQNIELIHPRTPEVRIGAVEIYGRSVFPERASGGDHIIYLPFAERYDLARRIASAREAGRDAVAAKLNEIGTRVGVLVADVSGHRSTDALVAAMLHQSFLTGVLYELEQFGEVTTGLFEILNTRFYHSLSIEKYVTFIYGEVDNAGKFRFVSAGSPDPLVFSAEFDRFVPITPDRLVSVYPLGMFPSESDIDEARNLESFAYKPRYTVNEVNLMSPGDILLLLTDGVADHQSDTGQPFLPDALENTLRKVKHFSARGIYEEVYNAAVGFSSLDDDMSIVVIKRSSSGRER